LQKDVKRPVICQVQSRTRTSAEAGRINAGLKKITTTDWRLLRAAEKENRGQGGIRRKKLSLLSVCMEVPERKFQVTQCRN
jgi:hypothetical protein